MLAKECSICKKKRLIKFFWIRSWYSKSQKKNILFPRRECKSCLLKRREQKYKDNPEKYKKYWNDYRSKYRNIIILKQRERYNKNKDKYVLKARQYRKKNKKIIRERQRLKRINNPEYYKEHRKKYYWKNRDKLLIKMRAYHKIYNQKYKLKRRRNSKEHYKNNLEYYKKRNKEHYKKNKEIYNLKAINRRLISQKQTPVWNNKVIMLNIYKKAKTLREQGKNVSVDHVIPLQGKFVTGLHVHNNLKIIPAGLNSAKKNKFKTFQSMDKIFGKKWMCN